MVRKIVENHPSSFPTSNVTDTSFASSQRLKEPQNMSSEAGHMSLLRDFSSFENIACAAERMNLRGVDVSWGIENYGFAEKWHYYNYLLNFADILRISLSNLRIAMNFHDLSTIIFETSALKFAALLAAAFRLTTLCENLQKTCRDEAFEFQDYPGHSAMDLPCSDETFNMAEVNSQGSPSKTSNSFSPLASNVYNPENRLSFVFRMLWVEGLYVLSQIDGLTIDPKDVMEWSLTDVRSIEHKGKIFYSKYVGGVINFIYSFLFSFRFIPSKNSEVYYQNASASKAYPSHDSAQSASSSCSAACLLPASSSAHDEYYDFSMTADCHSNKHEYSTIANWKQISSRRHLLHTLYRTLTDLASSFISMLKKLGYSFIDAFLFKKISFLLLSSYVVAKGLSFNEWLFSGVRAKEEHSNVLSSLSFPPVLISEDEDQDNLQQNIDLQQRTSSRLCVWPNVDSSSTVDYRKELNNEKKKMVIDHSLGIAEARESSGTLFFEARKDRAGRLKEILSNKDCYSQDHVHEKPEKARREFFDDSLLAGCVSNNRKYTQERSVLTKFKIVEGDRSLPCETLEEEISDVPSRVNCLAYKFACQKPAIVESSSTFVSSTISRNQDYFFSKQKLLHETTQGKNIHLLARRMCHSNSPKPMRSLLPSHLPLRRLSTSFPSLYPPTEVSSVDNTNGYMSLRSNSVTRPPSLPAGSIENFFSTTDFAYSARLRNSAATSSSVLQTSAERHEKGTFFNRLVGGNHFSPQFLPSFDNSEGNHLLTPSLPNPGYNEEHSSFESSRARDGELFSDRNSSNIPRKTSDNSSKFWNDFLKFPGWAISSSLHVIMLWLVLWFLLSLIVFAFPLILGVIFVFFLVFLMKARLFAIARHPIFVSSSASMSYLFRAMQKLQTEIQCILLLPRRFSEYFAGGTISKHEGKSKESDHFSSMSFSCHSSPIPGDASYSSPTLLPRLAIDARLILPDSAACRPIKLEASASVSEDACKLNSSETPISRVEVESNRFPDEVLQRLIEDHEFMGSEIIPDAISYQLSAKEKNCEGDNPGEAASIYSFFPALNSLASETFPDASSAPLARKIDSETLSWTEKVEKLRKASTDASIIERECISPVEDDSKGYLLDDDAAARKNLASSKLLAASFLKNAPPATPLTPLTFPSKVIAKNHPETSSSPPHEPQTPIWKSLPKSTLHRVTSSQEPHSEIRNISHSLLGSVSDSSSHIHPLPPCSPHTQLPRLASFVSAVSEYASPLPHFSSPLAVSSPTATFFHTRSSSTTLGNSSRSGDLCSPQSRAFRAFEFSNEATVPPFAATDDIIPEKQRSEDLQLDSLASPSSSYGFFNNLVKGAFHTANNISLLNRAAVKFGSLFSASSGVLSDESSQLASHDASALDKIPQVYEGENQEGSSSAFSSLRLWKANSLYLPIKLAVENVQAKVKGESPSNGSFKHGSSPRLQKASEKGRKLKDSSRSMRKQADKSGGSKKKRSRRVK